MTEIPDITPEQLRLFVTGHLEDKEAKARILKDLKENPNGISQRFFNEIKMLAENTFTDVYRLMGHKAGKRLPIKQIKGKVYNKKTDPPLLNS